MISFRFIQKKLGILKNDSVVYFVAKEKLDEKEKQSKHKKNVKQAEIKLFSVASDLKIKIRDLNNKNLITGSHKESVYFREATFAKGKDILFVGLGNEHEINGEKIRQAGAAAFHSLKSNKCSDVLIEMDSLPISAMNVQALVEGFMLASYEFDSLKKRENSKSDELKTITFFTERIDKELATAFATAQIMSESTNFSRKLGDMPANLMTPSILGKEAVLVAKGIKNLKVTVWDEKRIAKEKMGAFLSVNKGSAEKARFIVMEYKGASSSHKPFVLVGKGLTFDAGGISIKPSAGMEEMKYDMCGGANMIGALLAIAKLKLKINAKAFVPCTENLLGHNPNKPGDVVTARNGKTIEVNNTDAEGRLILADALVYASEQRPAVIVDMATLTGAMAVALGNIHTGFFTRNEELLNKIQNAARVSGELVWHMPLTDAHVGDMKGTFADLSNMSSAKGAGSATAAAFLEHFVDKEIPWAHFDIAGTAWNANNRLNYVPKKGATGAMIRTLVELAKQYE